MATDHLPSKVTVLFKKEKSGVVYRIPSLLYLDKNQTFLAFAEKRASARDVNAEILVLRRGKLGEGSVKWDDVKELKTAIVEGHRTMNPCPVYERNNDKVYLFFECIKKGVLESSCKKGDTKLGYVVSGDAGDTWSPVTDLTDLIKDKQTFKWITFAVGPGHGIQTQLGRLLVPANAYIRRRSSRLLLWSSKEQRSFYFYSDDHGDNWMVGELITEYQAGECQLAEITIADNSHVLYCNARTGFPNRMEAWGQKAGHFKTVSLAKGLVETKGGCQGSVVSFPAPKTAEVKPGEPDPQGRTSWLLYTHPTGESGRLPHKRNRTNLGVYVNQVPLQTQHWQGPWVIQTGPSGYSDLAYLDDLDGKAAFACLYECGVALYCEQIAFWIFTVEDVLKRL